MDNLTLIKDIQKELNLNLSKGTQQAILEDFKVFKKYIQDWNNLYLKEKNAIQDDKLILTEGMKEILPLGAYILSTFRQFLTGREIVFSIAPTYQIDITDKSGKTRAVVQRTSLKNEISFKGEEELLLSYIENRIEKGAFTSNIRIENVSTIGTDLSDLDKNTIDVIYQIIIRERVQFVQKIYNNADINKFETYYISKEINPKFSTKDMVERPMNRRVYQLLKNSTRAGENYWRKPGYRNAILIQTKDGRYMVKKKNGAALYAVAEIGKKRIAKQIGGNEGHYFEALLHGASSLINSKGNLKKEYDIVDSYLREGNNYVIDKHISALDIIYQNAQKNKSFYNVDQANIAAHGNIPFYQGADVNFKLYAAESELNNNYKIISLQAKRQNSAIKGRTIINAMEQLNLILNSIETKKDFNQLLVFFTDNTQVGISKEVNNLDEKVIKSTLKILQDSLK